MNNNLVWQGNFSLTGHTYHSGLVIDNQFKFLSVDGNGSVLTIDMPTIVSVAGLFPSKRVLKITI